MKILIAAIAAALIAAPALAGPMTFTQQQFTTTTFAMAGAQAPDQASDSSPPSAVPLLTASESEDDDASAEASALADYDENAGTYTLSALAGALGGPLSGLSASGLASAAFVGEFTVAGGLFDFFLDMSGGTAADGAGTADAVTRVKLIVGTETIVDEVLTGLASLSGVYTLPIGAQGILSVESIASADAAGAGDLASAQVGVGFTARQLPEPGGWALVSVALVAAVVSRKKPGKRVGCS